MLIPEKANKLVLWEKRVFLEEQTPQPEQAGPVAKV